MTVKHIYTSLDIGSDSIKIVVCELYQNRLNLLAATNIKSAGIKRGLITNVELASKCIKKAFDDISDMVGFKVNKTIVNVPSYLAEYSIIKGNVDVDSTSPITNRDIMKSLEVAIKTKKLKTREMVTVLPIDFKVDNDIAIKEPIGLKGSKLSVRAVLVSVPKKNVYSVLGVLETIGIEVVDISTNNIGDMYSFRNKNFEEKVSAIINIGSDTTSVSIYNRSVIVKSSILNCGGKNIDDAIAANYNISTAVARKLKHKYALASKKHAKSNDSIVCDDLDGKSVKINQYELSEIVEKNAKDILNLAKNELNTLTSKRIDYIIITGGMSNIAAFEYASYDIFGENINIGSMKMIGVRNNKYSSVVGNIVYFISKLKLKGQNYSMIDDGDNTKSISRTPDSTLSKVFGYFFAS